MCDKVKLKKVIADNWEVMVVGPELGAGQVDFASSNLYSVAEVQFDPRHTLRGSGVRIVMARF